MKRIAKRFAATMAVLIGLMIVTAGFAVPVYGAYEQSTYEDVDTLLTLEDDDQAAYEEALIDLEQADIEDVEMLVEESTLFQLDIRDFIYSVNGALYQLEQVDLINNHAMVPLRFVAESLGASVGWIDEIRTITIEICDISVSLQVDTPLPNGMGLPLIIDGRTFVPIDYVAFILDIEVRWDEDTQAVYTEDAAVADPFEPVDEAAFEQYDYEPPVEDITDDDYEPPIEAPPMEAYLDEAAEEEIEEDIPIPPMEMPIDEIDEDEDFNEEIYEEVYLDEKEDEKEIDETDETEDIPLIEDDPEEKEEEKEIEDIIRPPVDEGPDPDEEDEEKEIEDIDQLPIDPYHPRLVLEPVSEEFYVFSRRLLELTNLERARYGIEPLIWDYDLERAARIHSMDMATNDFIDHVGSNGLTPGGRVRLESHALIRVAENIAGGTRTPEHTVAAWMRSPGHRANILNADFRYMGVGIYSVDSSRWVIYITQKFGL